MNWTWLFVLFCLVGDQAFAACDKPLPPPCAMRSAPFANDVELQQCRIQMESYQAAAGRYGECRQNELLLALEEATKEATQDLDEVAAKFTQAVNAYNQRSGQLKKPVPVGGTNE